MEITTDGGLEPTPSPRRPIPAWLVRLGLAAAGVTGLRFGLELWPPIPDEPALVRWLRVVDEHPVRTGGAIALTLWALRRRGPAGTPAPAPERAGKAGMDGLQGL